MAVNCNLCPRLVIVAHVGRILLLIDYGDAFICLGLELLELKLLNGETENTEYAPHVLPFGLARTIPSSERQENTLPQGSFDPSGRVTPFSSTFIEGSSFIAHPLTSDHPVTNICVDEHAERLPTIREPEVVAPVRDEEPSHDVISGNPRHVAAFLRVAFSARYSAASFSSLLVSGRRQR